MNASTGLSRIKHKEVQKLLQLDFKGIAAGKTVYLEINITCKNLYFVLSIIRMWCF